MINDIFVTKIGMTQAWTTEGKRIAVTRCRVQPNMVIAARQLSENNSAYTIEVGYGKKLLRTTKKPLRAQLAKSGFSVGVKTIRGIKVDSTESDKIPAAGTTLAVSDVLSLGDVVNVRGTTKGRGFAGGMKRYGYKGGPKTHGQSDRARAIGSIGAGTSPGRVLKGKGMPGHMGDVAVTVKGLTIVHIDTETQEVWISGPVPGSISSDLLVHKLGKTKKVELNYDASGIKLPVEEVKEEAPVEVEEVAEKTAEETKE
ncbi:MAG: 50S ribosomal protein L3 [Candidatus Pacebacteria bacterium CG10_big_fil_rev_8_21_14_0_10_42_12]|nr:MAG: 50S ribosomal protein L3 [Candidatus Pacebacteria bacterium CG10_big_fil_rev_8_21_14_0_10_42_12]